MKLSVVIVNYNVRYFLEQALQSVFKATEQLKQHSGAQTEVWVVDNNSADDSLEMLQERFPQVKLIANKQNTGFSYANNQAIREATGEYILLLNPDTVVPEDNFVMAIAFMDSHPDVGGLGVKMLDGRGHFLPESKRGFPSPAVAFYKIFGFSRFFPKSKTFGRYHLGYLDKEETHEVDVLAGAYMLLRRQALNKVGLLDEDFFMYGEDIDLSYRIVKAGYKNYYFADTDIIHYKGESTKKSSINYVFIFYKAMVIFARKHLPKKSADAFSVLINLAIYLRAGAAIAMRIVKRLTLPLVDALVLYGGMALLVHYWEHTIKYIKGGSYPPVLLHTVVPVAILIWIIGLFLAKGYQKPYLDKKIIRGVIIGTAFIAIIYAFLDEHYRFSRALIVLGAGLAAVVFAVNRILLELLTHKKLSIDRSKAKKVIILGDLKEAARVEELLARTNRDFNIVGTVWPGKGEAAPEYLGDGSHLGDLLKIYKIDEIIFCARNMAYKDIIDTMSQFHRAGVDFKIVPEDSAFVIGSNSKNEPGDYYTFENEFAINKPDNRLNKKIFDVAASVCLLLSLPFNIWFVRNTGRYLSNIFAVLSGRRTWVGYSSNPAASVQLPHIRRGVLSPADELHYAQMEEKTMQRLDYLYAKDYSIYKDISIFLNAFSKLGKQQNHE